MGEHLLVVRPEYCAEVTPWKGQPAGTYRVKYWRIRTPFRVSQDAAGYVVERRGVPVPLPRRNYNMAREARELVADLWERISHDNR